MLTREIDNVRGRVDGASPAALFSCRGGSVMKNAELACSSWGAKR
jgi:hypothetical protein